MKYFYPILLLTVLLCTFYSCKKDPPPTVLEGNVIDSESGAPIPNALIEIIICKLDKIGLCKYIYKSVLSNQNGFFSYTLGSDAESGSLSAISADNYIFKKLIGEQYKWQKERVNYFSIPLIKSDGALKIIIRNVTGQHDFVNIEINNPTLISEADELSGRIVLFPVNLSTGEEKEYIFPLISNEYTKIFWGFDYFNHNNIQPEFQDSVFLLLNDTLTYSITF